MLKYLKINNLLSYGPESNGLELGPLNVVIGANGSGKSNLLEIIGLLKAAPENLAEPVKESGGVSDWLYQNGSKTRQGVEACIDVIVECHDSAGDLRHTLQFTEHGQRFEVVDEKITYPEARPGKTEPYFFYKYQRGHPVLNQLKVDADRSDNTSENKRQLKREEVHPEQSILSQIKDPSSYRELSFLSKQYSSIFLMRDWTFGRYTKPRQEQKLGLPSDILTDTCDNLPLVLAEILPEIEEELVHHLQALYPRIKSIYTKPVGDRLQLFFKEGKKLIPATRLSDGTLRYLCILTALLHPNPAPLICIDEPELGLHPDVLPSLADLLLQSSQRTQLIVTTHSDILVDALHDHPETIVTAESSEAGTSLHRLDVKDLEKWLNKYSLGELWTRGEIGGVRT